MRSPEWARNARIGLGIAPSYDELHEDTADQESLMMNPRRAVPDSVPRTMGAFPRLTLTEDADSPPQPISMDPSLPMSPTYDYESFSNNGQMPMQPALGVNPRVPAALPRLPEGFLPVQEDDPRAIAMNARIRELTRPGARYTTDEQMKVMSGAQKSVDDEMGGKATRAAAILNAQTERDRQRREDRTATREEYNRHNKALETTSARNAASNEKNAATNEGRAETYKGKEAFSQEFKLRVLDNKEFQAEFDRSATTRRLDDASARIELAKVHEYFNQEKVRGKTDEAAMFGAIKFWRRLTGGQTPMQERLGEPDPSLTQVPRAAAPFEPPPRAQRPPMPQQTVGAPQQARPTPVSGDRTTTQLVNSGIPHDDAVKIVQQLNDPNPKLRARAERIVAARAGGAR